MDRIGKDIPTIGKKEQWLKMTIKNDKLQYEVIGLSPFDIITLATGLINDVTKRLAENIAVKEVKEDVKH